jgi:hypothetical protein
MRLLDCTCALTKYHSVCCPRIWILEAVNTKRIDKSKQDSEVVFFGVQYIKILEMFFMPHSIHMQHQGFWCHQGR